MQGFVTIAHSAIDTAKQGPVHIAAHGIRGAGFALSQLSSVFEQPEAYINWTKGLVNTGVGLAGYVIKDLRQKVFNSRGAQE
jgi:hypothetical protein